MVVSPPRRAVSLAFANGVGPARTAVVLTPPLLAYSCCGWVFFEGVQAARVVVVIPPPRTLLFVGAVPFVVTVGSSSSRSRCYPGPRHPD